MTMARFMIYVVVFVDRAALYVVIPTFRRKDYNFAYD